jgi:hypothetical protein
MSIGYVALGTAAVSSIYGANQQKKAAGRAADIQSESAALGIEEDRRQFDEIIKLMAPYVEGGEKAQSLQQDFIGISGPEAEARAIQGIKEGPQYGAMVEQGEEAILQSASATGGLRGGNVQGALAQYRPQILSDLIQQRFSQLGGLATRGQNAAAMQGEAGLTTAQSIGGQYAQQGAARAGEALARGEANMGIAKTFGNIGGFMAGKKF